MMQVERVWTQVYQKTYCKAKILLRWGLRKKISRKKKPQKSIIILWHRHNHTHPPLCNRAGATIIEGS